MEPLITLITFEIWFLLGALLVVVVHQMLNGRINSRELLLDKDDGTVSPVRVQLLIFTLIGAGTYLALIYDPAATDNLQKMPFRRHHKNQTVIRMLHTPLGFDVESELTLRS